MHEKSYLAIRAPKGDAFTIKTRPDFIKLHAVILAIAKRGSGKTVALTNVLRMMQENQALDRLILVSGTYHNNTSAFAGLPLDSDDVLEPTRDAPAKLASMLSEMGAEYDAHQAKLKRWLRLQALIRGDTDPRWIDAELLREFPNPAERPWYAYRGKPTVAIMFDDCQGSPCFAPSSGLSNLVIKHRHLGATCHGALGATLLFATQSYTSNAMGLPRSVRANVTHMLVFRTKSGKELEQIAEEVSGEVSHDDFLVKYEQAVVGRHDFLFIDLHPKAGNSMFRRNMDTML
jgi:hypothetical protein